MQQNILLHSGVTFWFKLNFLLPKNESVLNILVYFLNEYTLKGSQLISSSDNKKILMTTRIVRLDSGHYATKYYDSLMSTKALPSYTPITQWKKLLNLGRLVQ